MPNAPTISAIVPARNEEPNIANCVRSVALQPEVLEILVINDQSTDHTAEIVRNLAKEIPILRFLETSDLPAGWVGKNNAVWLGAQQAKGKWLLFTDADATLAAGATAKAFQLAAGQYRRSGLVFPRARARVLVRKGLNPLCLLSFSPQILICRR